MTNIPFLTIAIPTWNRSEYLKKNLDQAILQIEQLAPGKVELLVSDNASDDETENCCRTYQARYSFFTYHRQEYNKGANANFQTVLSLARGEYVWLMGDDDLLAENILEKIIHDLNEHKPAVALGACIYDDTKQKATLIGFNKLFHTNQALFNRQDIIAIAGKMSSVIFKSVEIKPILAFANTLIESSKTAWPHLAWLILCLNHPDKTLLILPYGINQLVAANWHNLLFTGIAIIKVHFVEYQKLMVTLRPHISPKLYRSLLKRMTEGRISVLLKSVLYATYIDSYWQSLSFSIKFLPKILGIKKIKFVLFFFSYYSSDIAYFCEEDPAQSIKMAELWSLPKTR